MIIKKITLNNFRQFYGEQEIVFVNQDTSKTVSVVYGENGRGKTSLYRALMFSLYGERRLAQESEGNEEVDLINVVALEESQKEGRTVEAFVSVNFSHKKKEYELKRTILGIKVDDEIHEQAGEVLLKIEDEQGNTDILTDLKKIEIQINSILDRRLREYFLFDGEKIEMLTRATREQKKEIQKGIKNLLNIDRLFVASDGIGNLLKSLERQLKNKSTGEHKQQLVLLEDKEKTDEDLKIKIEKGSQELEMAQKVFKEINLQLKKYEAIEQFLKDREETLKILKNAKEDRNELVREMVNKNDSVGLILIEEEMCKVGKMLNAKIQDGELPSKIRESLVDRILDEGKCICTTPLVKDSKEYKAILEWKNKIMDVKVEQSLLEVSRDIGRTSEKIDYIVEQVQKDLQEFSVKSETIEESEQRLAYISDQIGDTSTNEDLSRLERDRNETVRKMAQLEMKNEEFEKKLRELAEEIKITRKNIKELEKKQGMVDVLIRKGDLTRESKRALDEIQEEFIVEIKEKISAEATRIFSKLIDKEGASTFKKIKISDDYSLQLYDWRDKPFLANISAGQRQITSIAFIASLAKIAGGADVLEMPLFMDTPFGRLSGVHRDNIIENIPKLTKQWILLATDTEFSSEEAKKLKKTNKWGKIYVLEGVEPYKTKIVEKDVDSFTPTRTRLVERS